MVVISMLAHNSSSPIHRIDHLSWATTFQATYLQGQTIMTDGRAKTGVKDSKETAFYVVMLAIGHRSVHPIAACNHYLHSYLSRTNYNKKTEHWAVCHCM